ncbi:hypothetical protein E2C01_061562 [Portunus trituberculatus]|uniref:Uncharacterized protein n=1 Tax=Portunus trituberculatus TaxID=210409 RepID=A0A5B7HDJ2_PORTR|nr:hypothetical protein [Portunus trituberculatus]
MDGGVVAEVMELRLYCFLSLYYSHTAGFPPSSPKHPFVTSPSGSPAHKCHVPGRPPTAFLASAW